MKHRLAAGFAPDADVVRAGGPDGLLPEVKGLVDAWRADAAAYGATGAPLERKDPTVAELAADGLGRPPPDPGVGRFHTRAVTLVAIELDGEGHVLDANVIGSSGNARHDRLALERARVLDRPEPVPPPGGAGKSVWAFETDLVVVPPAPIAGCSVYADFSLGECYYPTKELVRSRVRIVAIYPG